jgi:hypothetical protein
MPTRLQTELALPAYTGLTDQQAADKLNARIAAGLKLVPVADISTLLIHSGELPAIGAKALTPTDPLFPVCYCVVEYFRTHEVVSLDAATPDGAKALEMLTACVSANLIGAASQAAIVDMANVYSTRGRQIGIPSRVMAFQVNAARSQH